jgi:hypothetical protein
MPAVLRFRSEEAEAAFRRIEAAAPAAVARALNRTITSSRVFMRRAVANDVGLLQRDVDKDFRVSPARPDNLRAVLEVRGKRIPLVKFGARGPLPTRGRPPYVTARIGGVPKTYGPGHSPTPFMAKMASGHLGVFARVLPSLRFSSGAWTRNLPIRELKGPSLVRVFLKYLVEGYAHAEAELVKNLEHELSFALKGLNAT